MNDPFHTLSVASTNMPHRNLRSLGTLFGTGLTLLPQIVWGHPGHGGTDPNTAEHYVREPVHIVPILMLLFCLAAAGVFYRWRSTPDARQSVPINED